jgi:hypothetical protein
MGRDHITMSAVAAPPLYDVGARYGIAPGLVSATAGAIVMSESWFEHRAIHGDRSGNVDIGLAQASDFARARMPELCKQGVVDVELTMASGKSGPWMSSPGRQGECVWQPKR